MKGIILPDFAFDVDHIDSNRDNNKINNLQVLCLLCHRKKTFINGNHASYEAKQALTSLIKELVAEAKPGKKHVGDEVAENRSYTGERLFNATIDEYHTNLLKALEDK